MTHHRRDDEDISFDHERAPDLIPSWIRWCVFAFKEIGFPAGMCLLIWWRSETTEKRQLEATEQLNYAMTQQAETLHNVLSLMTARGARADDRWDHFLAEFRASRK